MYFDYFYYYYMLFILFFYFFFFFNDTATTEIYTLSLHDALPIPTDRNRDRRASTRPPNSPPTSWPGGKRRGGCRTNPTHRWSYAPERPFVDTGPCPDKG